MRKLVLLAPLCALLTGCPMMPAPPDEAPRWRLFQSGLAAGLLSVSGTSASDVIAVGADSGAGPLVLHYNGQSWRELSSGARGDLWWITDRKLGASFFLVGEGGLILEYRTTDGSFVRHNGPGAETLFGAWGSAANNVYAVGGVPDEIDSSGVIWHYNGATWTNVDLSSIFPAGAPVLWKIWGRNASDIYVCGERGTLLHYDGAQWMQLPSPTTRTLFTIHGNATRVVTCGGRTSGVIAESINGTFSDVTPGAALQMNGTFVPASGEPVTVGAEGGVAFGRAAGWELEDTGLDLETNISFHAAWGDPDGGIWAVGGNLFNTPALDGVIAYFGAADPAGE
jgi:hypothetical protein